MSFLKKFAPVLTAVMIVVAGPPGTGFALELGLKHSHVFGLWTNINNAMLAYARNITDDEAWLRRLSELEPRKFSGKTHKDVLEKVELFEAKLSKLAIATLFDAERTSFAKEVTFLLRDSGSVVTPSLVFLVSGRVLVNMTIAVVDGADPFDRQPISPYFAEHGFTGKVSSDVYGLVDLALRRLDKIQIEQRASPRPRSKARP